MIFFLIFKCGKLLAVESAANKMPMNQKPLWGILPEVVL